MRPSYLPPDLTGKDLFDYVVKNERLIKHAKKVAIKYADPTLSTYHVNPNGGLVSKNLFDTSSRATIPEDAEKLSVDLCINTTNYFDSHWDVHIPGLWKKSLSDNAAKGFYLLNRHRSEFEHVIGDELKGRTTQCSWKDLGFQYIGVTEALMFSGMLEKSRNEFMFKEYAKGRVKQHSVGMGYVAMSICINDSDYPTQKENWEKYAPMVVNLKDAEEVGFFCAVTEAKIFEGSAVLFGSNGLTPSVTVEEYGSNKSDTSVFESEYSTQDEPSFDLMAAIKNTKFY